MLLPGGAWALDVGNLQWRAATTSAPAQAEILLQDKAEIDPAGIRARLGVKESYSVAGLTYLPEFAQVQVRPRKRDDGRVVLRLEGLPADAPRLDLLVTVNYQLKMTLAEFRVDPRRATAEFSPLVPGAQMAGPGPSLEGAAAALQAWADAWRRKDVDAYLAAYAPDHVGRGATDAAAWRAQRRERIQARSRIDVQLSELSVKAEGPRAVATFVQRYRADGLHETVRKRVVLAPDAGRWLIVEEGEQR